GALGGQSFAYDQGGHLTSATTTGPTATYTYDATGLLNSETVNGVTQNFTWNQAQGLPTLLSNGSDDLIYGPEGTPIEQINPGGATYYLLGDELGSTRIITDSSGNIAGTFTYDPYGTIQTQTGSVTPLVAYAGEPYDADTGLYYLGARFYDPAIAQFLTRDPLAASTGAPYSYASGSPLNFTDPSGLCAAGAQGGGPQPPNNNDPLLPMQQRANRGVRQGNANPGEQSADLLIQNEEPVPNGVIEPGESEGYCTNLPTLPLEEEDPGGAAIDPGAFHPAETPQESDWPVQEGSNCVECAKEIQKKIGGEIETIEPPEGARFLGPSTNNPEGPPWNFHTFVVKNGRAFDGPTGPQGMPLNEYIQQWEYGNDLIVRPGAGS
ncbi:MAG: RHS repeat-associated core domain-containing protein, partial [Acidimicrobiales bacterium]